MKSGSPSLAGNFQLAIEEDDLSRIVQWADIKNTELMDVYFKQRLGPGFRMVPVVGISRKHFESLIKATDGTDLYGRMCEDEPDAAIEAAFTLSVHNAEVMNVTFGIDVPYPGKRFIDFLNRNGTTDFHREFVKHLQGVSKDCHDLHVKWKSSGVRFHAIARSLPGR